MSVLNVLTWLIRSGINLVSMFVVLLLFNPLVRQGGRYADLYEKQASRFR